MPVHRHYRNVVMTFDAQLGRDHRSSAGEDAPISEAEATYLFDVEAVRHDPDGFRRTVEHLLAQNFPCRLGVLQRRDSSRQVASSVLSGIAGLDGKAVRRISEEIASFSSRVAEAAAAAAFVPKRVVLSVDIQVFRPWLTHPSGASAHDGEVCS